MTGKPPTLRQLLHVLTADHALLDEPLEFTFTEWANGRAELARCVVTGLTVRQFKGRPVQTLKYDDIGAEYDAAGWEAAATDDPESEGAFAAWREATGGMAPFACCHTPEDVTAATREILAWWDRREGHGPWCWECAKPATSRRVEGAELAAYHCDGCRGPGVHVSLEIAADGSWRGALGIPDGFAADG